MRNKNNFGAVEDVIRSTSKRLNISVWEAGKICYQYEKTSAAQNCQRCRHSITVGYKDRKALQCEVIGICGNADANISPNYTCKKWER